jgi:hypothetical protein
MRANDPRRMLFTMLSYMRPMGGRAERSFRNRFILPLPGATTDAHGNIHIVIARPDGAPSRVVWSSHTDTVHRRDGRQRLMIAGRYVGLHARAHASNCLGADDTVGVWLMINMVTARVPGHYIFHWGEERGGIGSRALATHDPDHLLPADVAIAFDRRGTDDVITHQGGMRCCSDAFARSLAEQLPDGYAPSSHGVYTDTAEYTDIIHECTNVSVGYAAEHSPRETLDHKHAARLLRALLTFDEDHLVVARVAGSWDDDDADDWHWRLRSTDVDALPGADFDPDADDVPDIDAWAAYWDGIYARTTQ